MCAKSLLKWAKQFGSDYQGCEGQNRVCTPLGLLACPALQPGEIFKHGCINRLLKREGKVDHEEQDYWLGPRDARQSSHSCHATTHTSCTIMVKA